MNRPGTSNPLDKQPARNLSPGRYAADESRQDSAPVLLLPPVNLTLAEAAQATRIGLSRWQSAAWRERLVACGLRIVHNGRRVLVIAETLTPAMLRVAQRGIVL